MAKTKKEKCAYCHGFGLAADLWGAGYRWTVQKGQTSMTARVNCDRCGTGGTPSGETVAERSRQRLAAIKNKR
jgi:hypothetical protein